MLHDVVCFRDVRVFERSGLRVSKLGFGCKTLLCRVEAKSQEGFERFLEHQSEMVYDT